MIALSLYLPTFPTDLTRRRLQLDPRQPILLVRDERQREIVAACCARAQRAGVGVEMTLSQARALLTSSFHQGPWDAPLLRRALRTLAHHALRFTPLVMPDHDGLLLDCAGCTHLYSGLHAMIEAIAAHFTRMGFAWRIGVAPHIGAAWAIARYADAQRCIIEATHLHAALSPLPIEALRLATEDAQALHTVGITTVAQLANIPRDALAERFGSGVLRRLDQAFGREPERFTPVRSRPPIHLGRAFAGPTDRPETIALCLQHLLAALAARLARRESGCRELLVILRRSDMPPVEITARASRPARDAKHWYTLLRPSLERAQLGFGVEGVEIQAQSVTIIKHEQSSRWLDQQNLAGADDAARLADTLKARLGEHRVLRMLPRASHTPERSWTAESPGAFQTPDIPALESPLDRPTALLPSPLPIDVIFLRPDGPIASIKLGGEMRRVLHCRSPERICGEWWRFDHDTRDYHQVQLEDGAWLWVFQSTTSGRWFLHGEWA